MNKSGRLRMITLIFESAVISNDITVRRLIRYGINGFSNKLFSVIRRHDDGYQGFHCLSWHEGCYKVHELDVTVFFLSREATLLFNGISSFVI